MQKQMSGLHVSRLSSTRCTTALQNAPLRTEKPAGPAACLLTRSGSRKIGGEMPTAGVLCQGVCQNCSGGCRTGGMLPPPAGPAILLLSCPLAGYVPAGWPWGGAASGRVGWWVLTTHTLPARSQAQGLADLGGHILLRLVRLDGGHLGRARGWGGAGACISTRAREGTA